MATKSARPCHNSGQNCCRERKFRNGNSEIIEIQSKIVWQKCVSPDLGLRIFIFWKER